MIQNKCLFSKMGGVNSFYITPQVEVIDLQTEKGFAKSASFTMGDYDSMEEFEWSFD